MNPTPSCHQFVGVDGGGTRTRALLLDANGKQVGYGTAAGSNPHNTSFPEAASRILEAIEATGVDLAAPSRICLGIAGLRSSAEARSLNEAILEAAPALQNAQLTLTHDLEIAHYAAFRGKPGIVLIAGTGSACYGVTATGESYRASGRDFHYEDPGSGYAIGKRAIDTKLHPPAETREAIAAIAPAIIEQAAAGHLKYLDILRIESEHLAKLACFVQSHFSKSRHRTKIALSGKILTAPSLYRESVRYELQKDLPGIKLVDAKQAPELAAAEMALQNLPGLLT